MEADTSKNFPLKIEDVEPELAEEMMKLFTGDHGGYIRVGPNGYFLPNRYREEASRIYNMPLKPDDVFVCTFPRSGTTWTQELVWMVENDLDYKKSDAVPLIERYCFIEYSAFIHPIMKEKFKSEIGDSEEKLKLLEKATQSGTDVVKAITSQRFIKTHLALSLLPAKLLDTAKVVYVARDPRDAVVSFYHLACLFRPHGYIGDFKTYWNYFKQNICYWAPFFEHVKEAWKMRHHPNLLFLFYEDLSKDLPSAVRQVASFFNKDFSEEQVAKLCEHLRFDNFKKNKSVNVDAWKDLGLVKNHEEEGFVRKGVVGGWRDYFDAEMQREAEEWIAENLRGTDICFPSMKQ